MIANALLITIALLLAYGFWLMGELKFMAAYKAVLLQVYGGWICASIAILFFNVFGAVKLAPAGAPSNRFPVIRSSLT